jgi:hypothetical protein
MPIVAIEHVQLAMPFGMEDAARRARGEAMALGLLCMMVVPLAAARLRRI